jgi:hypothetical protein
VKFLRLLTLLFAASLASCASDSGEIAQKKSDSPRQGVETTVDDWVSKKSKDNGFVKDSSGNLVPKSDKRSSFESQGKNSQFSKQFSKKAYQTNDYTKKTFGGNKDYGLKQYGGNTDGSRFQTTSALQGKNTREAGQAAKIPGPYQTDNYATSAAREAGAKRITSAPDDLTENRHAAFKQPEIYDYSSQRALSIEQSKGVLGR